MVPPPAPSAHQENEEYWQLRKQIEAWNSSRLSLFEISLPNESLEFFGVMRFYLYDRENEVQTKCMRISSSATTEDVIEALLTKFWTDLKNLDKPQTNPDRYSLFECVHTGERRLKPDEFPLIVQLNWTEDCREGRFLLKCNDPPAVSTNHKKPIASAQNSKKSKKKEKAPRDTTRLSLSERLFSEKPESSFTRSIANHEKAMQLKREEKVDAKLKQFESNFGGPDSGGPLKIFGTKLKQEYNYKSLLVGNTDTAAKIVEEALKKFDISTPDPHFYCLVQVVVPPGKEDADYLKEVVPNSKVVGGRNGAWSERYLEDVEVPWQNFTSFPKQSGTLMFCLQHRPPELMRHKCQQGQVAPPNGVPPRQPEKLAAMNGSKPIKQFPYLIELPSGNTRTNVLKYDLVGDTTEIGSDPRAGFVGGQFLQLHGPGIRPHHCILAQSDPGTWTIAPSDSSCDVLINGHPIGETVVLSPGAVVQISQSYQFQFVVPQLLKNPSAANIRRSSVGMINPDPMAAPVSLQRGVRPMPGAQPMRQLASPTSSVRSSQFSVPVVASPVSPEQVPDIYRGPDPNFDFSLCIDTEETALYTDDELPVIIEFDDETEEQILNYSITCFDEVMTMFKVAPAFLFYMCMRYRISSKYNASIVFRVKKTQMFLSATCHSIASVLQTRGSVACSVAVWMANCAELYHFVHQDTALHKYTPTGQESLYKLTRLCSKTFVKLVIQEIDRCFSAFFDSSDRDTNIPPEVDLEIDPTRSTHYLNRWITSDIVGSRNETPELTHIIEILASAWVLLRKCRVNAALNLQIFTSVFRYVTSFIFNTMLASPHLCTEAFSERISRRIRRVENWAGREGLEIAAETEFAKIKQALLVIKWNEKFTQADAENLTRKCTLLNSLQIHKLLENIRNSQAVRAQDSMSREFLGYCIDLARKKVDSRLKENNKQILLEEDLASRALFRMPDDGFATDNVLGISKAFEKFLNPLMDNEAAYISVLPDPSPRWDIYLYPDHIDPATHLTAKITKRPGHPSETSIASSVSNGGGSVGLAGGQQQQKSFSQTPPLNVTLEKVSVELTKIDNSLGLSIVANQTSEGERAIFIKSVLPDGAAGRDGRLRVGDQIIQVDQYSLRGLQQKEAGRILTNTGQTVRLVVLSRRGPGAEAPVINMHHNKPLPDPNQNRWSQPPISQNIPPTMRPKSVHEEGLSRNSASRGGPDSFTPPLQGGRKSYDAAAQQVHEAEVNYGRNMNETQMSATMNPYNSLGRQRYKNAVPKDDFRHPYSQDDHNRNSGARDFDRSDNGVSYATLPRGDKSMSKALQIQYSDDPSGANYYNSMERRQRGIPKASSKPMFYNQNQALSHSLGSPISNRNDPYSNNQYNDPRYMQSKTVDFETPPGYSTSQPPPYAVQFSRRQESDMSVVAGSYEPNQKRVQQKFSRPYQITPDNSERSHKLSPSNAEAANAVQPLSIDVKSHAHTPSFPAPPPSWHEQQEVASGGSQKGQSLGNPDPHMKPPSRLPQYSSTDSNKNMVPSAMSVSSSSSHPTSNSDSWRSDLIGSINQPVLSNQQLRKNEEQMRFERLQAAVRELEDRESELTNEEQRRLDRMRLDVKFNMRLQEEESENTMQRKVSDDTAFSRAFSKKAAEQVQTDISKAQQLMQEAQMDFEARAKSKEHQRKLVSQAKLRDLNAEIEENRLRTGNLELEEPPMTDRSYGAGKQALSSMYGYEPKSLVRTGATDNGTGGASSNGYQYLEEQKQRYLQRRQEIESYQLEKEREKDAENQRRVEELRWRREMDRLQMRKIQQQPHDASFTDDQFMATGVDDSSNDDGSTPRRPPAPIIDVSDSSDNNSSKTPDTRNVTFNQDVDVRLRSTSSFENDNSPLNKAVSRGGGGGWGSTEMEVDFPSRSAAQQQNRVSRNSVDFSLDSNSGDNSGGTDVTSRVKPPLPPKPKGQVGASSVGTNGSRTQEDEKSSSHQEKNQQLSKVAAKSTPLYDSSLSPEERMRLYRQQLQFS